MLAKTTGTTAKAGRKAAQVELRAIASLRPYPRNARVHSPEQIGQIAAAITEFGWTLPLLIDVDDMILAGHGRVEAAKRLGIETAPVIVARGNSEAQQALWNGDHKPPIQSSARMPSALPARGGGRRRW
jgi:hypothetical protein